MNLLYTKSPVLDSLSRYFSSYFANLTRPTRQLLTNLLLGMVAMNGDVSIRSLHRGFLSRNSSSSLNSYYAACRNKRLDDRQMMQQTVRFALQAVPKELRNEPVFLSTDDTMIAKSGRHFDEVSWLFDHACHDGHPYVNGHCFVSLTLCVPVVKKVRGISRIAYLPVPVGYTMWTKGGKSKLDLAADLVDSVMPILHRRQVVLMFDSWYMKKPFLERLTSYENLSLIGNARGDSAMFDLPVQREDRMGRPKKYGCRLTMQDFPCTYRYGDFHVGHRQVMTRLFGDTAVHAYVTRSKSGSTRLFFSTVDPEKLHMSGAWQAQRSLRQAGIRDRIFYPLRLYKMRWHIETGYYEQKKFWELENYMLRSRNGIEHLLNLVNVAHSAMRLLPYLNPKLAGEKECSAQEVRSYLSGKIQMEVLFGTLALQAQTSKKSRQLDEALKLLFSCLGEAA